MPLCSWFFSLLICAYHFYFVREFLFKANFSCKIRKCVRSILNWAYCGGKNKTSTNSSTQVKKKQVQNFAFTFLTSSALNFHEYISQSPDTLEMIICNLEHYPQRSSSRACNTKGCLILLNTNCFLSFLSYQHTIANIRRDIFILVI